MKKKIALSLALLAGLVMGATSANAAEIKATGSWQVDAGFTSSNYFGGSADSSQKTVSIDQRIRTAFQFIANENLKGVFELQSGTTAWGNDAYQIGAGRATTDAATNDGLRVRKAFIDFNWPQTKNRFLVGYQSISLPSAFGGGSAIFDDHMAGAAAVIPVTDAITLVGGYARPNDAADRGATTSIVGNSSADAAFLYSNLKFSGFEFNPFAMYAYSGRASGTVAALSGLQSPGVSTATGMKAYWAGTGFTMTALDPFKVMADVNYGKADYNDGNDASRSGWLFDLAVDYTGLSMMTPSLFFAYSTGENGNAGKSERMPVVSAENWAIGSFWMQGGNALTDNYTDPSGNLGFWAAGLSLKDIKLVDKLTHTFNLIYFKGTNDKDIVRNGGLTRSYGTMLTEKDSLVEVDLNSKYQIYEELSLGLELGYIFADFDKDVWAGARSQNQLDQNAYKATFMLNYSF